VVGVDEVVARLRRAGCVFAEDEAELLRAEAGADADRLARLIEQRVSGYPLEHVLGWVRFCGLRIRLLAGVFVPRRRTELLARTAAELLAGGEVAVDVCCGSGAVAAAVQDAVPQARVWACDLDQRAVICAGLNLAAERVRGGDLFAGLPVSLRGGVRVITANAPYVPSDAVGLMPPEAREYEPRTALDGGGDGLGVQRRVAAEAGAWLAPGGSVLIETGADQAARTCELLEGAGLAARIESCAELEATVAIGTLAVA
jgi:release factor glutamine methyltransferase